MGTTEQTLAEFIATFPPDRIPPEIMHIGKRLLLNEVGVALYASKDPAIGILMDLFAYEGCNALATVIGLGIRTSPRQAALANGFLGHFEDYDDTHLDTVIHTASPIYPAALASAEAIDAGGDKLLAAGVLGIEVACRLGRLIVPNFREAAGFWHITNTCGVFGAAAASSRLLGLTPRQIEHALGIAGTQAMGLREVFGSMTKPFHAGKAAENGLLAAQLAQRGFTSISAESKGILEGARGFAAVMAEGYDLADLTRGLGEAWELPEIAIKAHACGQANQPLLGSMAQLRTKPGVTPDNIESIHGTVQRMAPGLATRRHPQKGLEGKFSYHHAMACVLVDGHAYPRQFTDAKVNDPLIISLRDRITVTEDPSLRRRAAAVSVTLKDGTTHSVTTEFALGTPGNPMSDGQLEDKFRALAGDVLPQKKVDLLVERLWSIESVRSMGELTTLLSASPKGDA
ncbi:MAG: MmgE/PrpD family protein [Alphaproteobacteria bacterium]|nr:MmgE/PrpD family protein [Alphaproteobacteria bacterium]